MPCDTLLTTRPSPMVNWSRRLSLDIDEARRHHLPRRIDARASRCAVASIPAGAMRAMRSPRMPMSAAYQALPVPSIDPAIGDDDVVRAAGGLARCARACRRSMRG